MTFRVACIVAIAKIAVSILSELNPQPPPVFFPLETAGYVLPLCTNVLTTGLILYRIWRLSISSATYRILPGTGRFAAHMSAILVKSGALYLATQLAFVVLITLEHPSADIIAGIACQIYVSDVASVRLKEHILTRRLSGNSTNAHHSTDRTGSIHFAEFTPDPSPSRS